jgi:integrase
VLFNIAIDSKLRGCDVVSLNFDDVAPHGYTVDRATIRQRKTGRPVKFEITEQTRQAIDDHLTATRAAPGDYLFRGRRRDRHLTTRRQNTPRTTATDVTPPPTPSTLPSPHE